MELRHLRYFVVLAEELHFGRAALRLAISQPPLSVNIRQLEEAIGTRLFDRNSKAVSLTAAGQAFLVRAKSLLAQVDDACMLAREIGDGVVGRLRVGFIGSLLFHGLPGWIQDFQAQFPNVQVVLSELNTQEQLDALAHKEIDVGFVYTRHIPDTMTSLLVCSPSFVCCVPEHHPAARRSKLALADLRDEAFIIFLRKASPDYYARIVEICVNAGFYPRVQHELRHWLSIVAAVSQGLGIALVPEQMEQSHMAGVRFVALEASIVASEVYCVWPTADDYPLRENFIAVLSNSPKFRHQSGGVKI